MHRLALGALAGFAVLTGCLKEKVPFCDNGAFCPEPLVCTERAEAPFCGRAGEVEPCMDQPEETACTLPGDVKGFCETGICKVCDEDNAACAYDGWVAMTSPVSVDLNAIWVAGPRDVYAVGNGGAVIRWTGRTWAVLPAPAGGVLGAIAGASATDIFAASVTSVFHYDGSAWSAATATPQAVLGMWGAAPGDFFLSGVAGMIGRFTGTWAFTNPTANNLNAISGTSNTNVYAVGPAGTVLHWNGTWTAQPTGTMHILRAVSAAGTGAFAAGRTQGGTPALLQYAGTWTDITAMLPSPVQTASVFLNGVWTNGTHTFVVGGGGTIVHSDGGPWMTMPTNTTVSLNAVGGSGSDVFAVGTGGKVLRYRIP